MSVSALAFHSALRIPHSVLDSLVLANPPADGLGQRLADALDRDAVENLLEEAGHDQTDGLLAGQAAAAGVEYLLVVHAAGRGAVRAADVVGLDLQPGNRIGVGLGG